MSTSIRIQADTRP